nr:immunoglobulin light chain junction region [Macaca mulatta]
CLQYSTSPWTF